MGGKTVAGNAVIWTTRVWLLRRTPLFWLLLSALSCAGMFFTWIWGAFSGGLDVAETCTLIEGRPYDDGYRAEHWREPSQVFPLHNKCNASYDLVPAWINPTLVLLALLAVGSLIIGLGLLISAVCRAVARYRTRRLDRSGDRATSLP
ncbi:hypothetical protein [Streptomyces rishiriensis]|uniref:Uncharacterized protein n=1 Tax=Streptomyces rishiriensis TaxID=68264 RepID=A0ABU0NQ78_STRRH|nr:hypothetical protein [Streptomyces rishiriensis]MDQ0580707.1 hypothetical protein [Streptomyces rishiriensis]